MSTDAIATSGRGRSARAPDVGKRRMSTDTVATLAAAAVVVFPRAFRGGPVRTGDSPGSGAPEFP